MEKKEPKIEYEVVSHREPDNRVVMICTKSEPEDMLTVVENSQDVAYEIHNGEDIYHLVEQTALPIKRPTPPLITSNNSSDSNNCQYFVINESAVKRPCLILPKPENFPVINDTQQKMQPKKRDDKRRATHNEVERRRRDKINHWIFKLKELLPEGSVTAEKNISLAVSSVTAKSSQNDSKSAILIKACDYVKDMQQELNSLKECLSNSENLHRENSTLKAENELLKNEIEQLKNGILGQKQICRPAAADSTNFETA